MFFEGSGLDATETPGQKARLHEYAWVVLITWTEYPKIVDIEKLSHIDIDITFVLSLNTVLND